MAVQVSRQRSWESGIQGVWKAEYSAFCTTRATVSMLSQGGMRTPKRMVMGGPQSWGGMKGLAEDAPCEDFDHVAAVGGGGADVVDGTGFGGGEAGRPGKKGF